MRPFPARLVLAAASLAAAGQASAQPAIDPARLAAARHLVAAMTPESGRDQRLAAMVNQLMGNMVAGMMQGQAGFQQAMQDHPAIRPIFARFVDKVRRETIEDLNQHLPELLDAQGKAYARLFSVEEMAAMQQFFATPAGQKFTAMQGEILKQPEFAEWQRSTAQRGQQRAGLEMAALKQDVEATIASEKKAQTHGS